METNDNIVAFWTPATAATPNQPYHIGYNISFGGRDLADQDVGYAINTFNGDGNIIGGGQKKGAYRLLVDFTGGPLDKLTPKAPVAGEVSGFDGTEVYEQYVEYNPDMKSWRLSMLVKPAEGKSLSLRAYLKEGERALTETWTYRLPPDNDIGIERE
jgi:glucans biosynthesis protein